MNIVASVSGPSVLGGWVRALVASLLSMLVVKIPYLAQFLDPTMQTTIAVGAGTIVSGLWSQAAKSGTTPVPDNTLTKQQTDIAKGTI